MSLINDYITKGQNQDGSPISEEDFVTEMQNIGEAGFLLKTDIFMTSIKAAVDLFNQLVQTGLFSEVDLQKIIPPMQQVSNLYSAHRLFYAHYVANNGDLPENLAFEKYVRILYKSRAAMFQMLDTIDGMQESYKSYAEQVRKQQELQQKLQQQMQQQPDDADGDNDADSDEDDGDKPSPQS